MTVNEMRLMFLDYMDDDRGRIWKPEKTYRFLNRGMEHVANILNNFDRTDLVASTDFAVAQSEADVETALPADFLKVQLVERLVTGDRPIVLQQVDFRDRENYWRSYPGITATYRDVYYVNAAVIGIVGPSEAYTVRLHYKRLPTVFTTGTQVPEFPSSFHNAVVLHAVALAKPSVLAVNGFREVYDDAIAQVTLSADGRATEVHYRLEDPENIF